MANTKKKAPEVATVDVQVEASSLVEPGSLAAIEAGRTGVASTAVKVAEGAARSKKAFEEGQIPGTRGRADDGKPSADDNAAANDRIRAAGLAAVHDFAAIQAKQSTDSHARMDAVTTTDPIARIGFDPNDHAVKYVNGEKPPVIVAGSGSPTTPAVTPVTPVVTPVFAPAAPVTPVVP